MLARVARLSLSGRAVLEAAAIIGPRVEPWLLNQVVQAEAPAISESLKFGFLQANADFFTFRHELVRQTIVDSLPLHQRAFWHQAVLDVLRNAAQTSHDTARLAHHAAAAQDVEAILHFGRAAGEEAAALGMHRAATSWFDLVMPYADRLTLVEQIELQIKAGVNNQSGDLRKSLAAFMQAAKLAQRANLVDEERLAQAHMAVVYYRSGELQQCDALLTQLLAQKEPAAPDAALNIAYPLQAMRHLLQGEAANAFEYANKARQMALKSGESEDIIRANQILGMCTLPLDHQKGLLELKASLHLALENHFYRAVGTIYTNLVMHSLDVYQTVEVDALVTAAKAYLAEHDLDFNLNLALAWEAMLRLYEGRWAECEAISNEILDDQTAPIARIPAMVAQGRLLARRGDFERAQELLNEAGNLSMKINNQQRIGIYYCAAAELAWLMGKRETVQQLVAEFMETAVKNRLPGFGGEIAYWSHAIGQEPALYEWMVAPFVLEIRGDWRGAATGWEALGCPYEQARALASGDVDAQKAALLLFEQLGAQPLANQFVPNFARPGCSRFPGDQEPQRKKIHLG